MEQVELFKVLDFWNYWNNDLEESYYRSEYLWKIWEFKKIDENIVLKWIRRSWKSTLLSIEIESLIKSWVKKENILFINFEEPYFFWKLDLNLLEKIWETYNYYIEPDKNKKIYIFLDEVQNVEAWEKWVLKFYEKKNIQFFITGSSSKLLSKEFSTALAWRHLSINVYPLSFKEMLSFKGINITNKLDIVRKEKQIRKNFEKYIMYWWFPKIVLNWEKKLIKETLLSYLDTIIIKDIAKRYSIRDIDDLKKLAYYFLSNDTKLFSVNKLWKLWMWSYETIKKYISYFKETYLFFELKKFDYSLKTQLINPKKIYSIDTGFVNLLWYSFSSNIWRYLENIVFMELKRREKEIYYYKEKKECDFVVLEKWKITEAIQVSYSLDDESTKKREVEWLKEVMQKHNLETWYILTYNQEYVISDYEYIIKVIPIWKWLL